MKSGQEIFNLQTRAIITQLFIQVHATFPCFSALTVDKSRHIVSLCGYFTEDLLHQTGIMDFFFPPLRPGTFLASGSCSGGLTETNGHVVSRWPPIGQEATM